jgi:hypothetical protein
MPINREREKKKIVYVANYKELIIIERREKVRARQREKDHNQCRTLMMK